MSHRSSQVVEGPLWLSTVDAKQVVRQAHHERRLGNADASQPVFPAKAGIQDIVSIVNNGFPLLQ